MYNQSYEDYMRSVLGYSFNPDMDTMNMNTYDNCDPYVNTVMNMNVTPSAVSNSSELEGCYPEIYRIVNPMVCKACNENTKPLTREVIEEMTEIIYRTVETVETTVEVKKVENKNGDVRNPNAKPVENRENRANNYLLRDLIKILILNQLLGGRPPRPPFPGGPGGGRPPFPGGPGPSYPQPPIPGPGGPGGPGRPPRPPFSGGPGPIVPPRPQPRTYNEF